MLDMSCLRAGTVQFVAYVVPCEFSPWRTPRVLGVLTEGLSYRREGDTTVLVQVTREPLLIGGYGVDSSAHDSGPLAPLWSRSHAKSLTGRVLFYPRRRRERGLRRAG